MNSTRRSLCAVVVLMSLVAAGCQPAATPSSPAPAAVVASASPTEPLPTATIASSPPAEPSATLAPEILATKPEHIAGAWLIKWVGMGSLARFDAVLTFLPDSTFSMDDKTDGMHIFDGMLQFADGKVTLDSNSCYDEVKAQFFHCTMTFTIYATVQDGKPVRIRFVSAGGTGTFHKNVDDKTLKLAAP